MYVSVPEDYRFTPTAVDTEMSFQTAAELQHVAMHAMRAAFGWTTGQFDTANYHAFVMEEARRIAQCPDWMAYAKTPRVGSRFVTNRRTRAATYVLVKTTNRLAALGA